MKKVKMINAFKAFELKSKSEINGGGKVTWANDGHCDIDYGVKEVCNVPDGAVNVGDDYKAAQNTSLSYLVIKK